MKRPRKFLMETLVVFTVVAATARADSLRLLTQNGYLPFTLVNTNGLAEWRDTNTAGLKYRFYRVRSEP